MREHPKFIARLLRRAATLLVQEAACLFASHSINGRWKAVADDPIDQGARKAYKDMRKTAEGLRVLSTSLVATALPFSWNEVSKGLPDDEMSVLMALSNGEVEPGFHEEGVWFYLCAATVEGGADGTEVTHWAEYPAAPLEA